MGYYESLSYYLFAKPSFIEGIARSMDFGQTMQIYNESETANEADSIAIGNDWIMTGHDLRKALDQYGQQT